MRRNRASTKTSVEDEIAHLRGLAPITKLRLSTMCDTNLPTRSQLL
jgi:hypothetical protein